MTTIPPDIQAALGDLTDKQRSVIERLVATIGADRARALVSEAQAKLATSNPSDPGAPKTVRGALTNLIQTTLPVPERNPILGLALPQYSLPPEIHQRYLALCERLHETEPPPRKLIRQVIHAIGIEAVEQAASDAEAIEAQGGMLLPDGSRRRTLGGVFFVLVRQRMTPEQRAPFSMWRDRPARVPRPEGSPPAAPPPPQLPAFVWKERRAIYSEVLQQQGEARVKVTVIGRPGRVVERQDVVILSVKMTKVPALPKGVPAPPPTVYTVYVARKQWGKVREAIQNPDDVLIIEGVAGYDPDMEGIVVSATSITTRALQIAKKVAPAAAEEAA